MARRGRKKTGRCRDVPHRVRPLLSSKHPVHVTLRLRTRISMRDLDFYHLFRRVMQRYLGRDDFRICHISIQHSHLHMLVEAASKAALSRGMQSFAILDCFSSATSFKGWTERFRLPPDYTPLPVSPPRTSLLRFDWQRHGLISPYEIPAQLR